MNLGIVGAGAWGKNLVKTLHNLGALSSVAESDESIREQLSRDYPDLNLFPDYRPMLEAIDAVAIATPAQTHYPIAKAALLVGKDVFVEKPLTLNSTDAEELVSIAEANGRILMVGHLLLYQPAITFIKNYITGGSLGHIFILDQERLNLGKVRSVENVLWSIGVHDIAVMLHLIGVPPLTCDAWGKNTTPSGVIDTVNVRMEFPNNLTATIHASWEWYKRKRSLTVMGARGYLVYDEIAQTVTLHRVWIDDNLNAVNEGSEVIFQGAAEPLKLEMEHFLTCCRTRQTPISDGKSSLEVIKILEQADAKL